jgi:hypothetical protein
VIFTSHLHVHHQLSLEIASNFLIRVRAIALALNLDDIAFGPTLSTLAIILVHLIDAILMCVVVVEGVERFEDGIFLHEDPSVDPVWEGLGHLVAHVCACGDGENVVEFFEGALLGFGNPEEDHDESDDVRTRVEAEDSLVFC